MSSQPEVQVPPTPVKAVRAKKEKVVKEKVVKEKVVKEKKEKVVKEKKEKVVNEEVVSVPVQVEEEVVADEKPVKKARVASLPAKYNKFIQYTYYMIRALNNAELEKTGEELLDEEKFFEAAKVFTEVDVQKEFVEVFLENKGIGKEMRTHLADKKKAEKAAAKQKVADEKAAAKKRVADEKAAAKAEKAAAKKPTKKSSKTAEPVDLVTSLVTLANSTTENVQVTEEEGGVEEEEEEEEMDVKVIEIDGKGYLVDEAGNLYDNSTHLMIGTWDCVTKEITHV